jgi:N-acetylgalactosamine-N,N'-diacetylbacillosaminyl-diphospho-undecaprenol 4-alpha-N-acetylgalactosaminyltransferase
MRIAVFIYSLGGGGAERVISQLVPYLENKRMEVFLVLMNEDCAFPLITKNNLYYIEKSRPNETSFIKFLKIPLLAYKYHIFLKKNDINLSLSFLTRPSLISSMSIYFNSNRKIIISERSNPSRQYGYGDLKSLINRFLIKKLFPKTDLIITNSIGNALDLMDNFKISKNRIRTIYNPINIKEINKINPIEGFFDNNYYNLLTIGRLDKGKNHTLLIKSIHKLKNKNVRLYIFGEGSMDKYLLDLISKYDLEENIFLMGFESNPFPYLKAADLFIFGSNHEGFPNVILEAMACNLPIISTNCPSGPNEIFEEDINYSTTENIITKYGILVPLNDENSMVAAINYMLQDENYYTNCKLSISTRINDFNSDLILQKYYDLLSEIYRDV